MMLNVDLKHRFDDFTLDVSFEAPAGITVLFGRSGSGKTSIANAVAGLLQPDKGRITLAGRVLTDTAKRIRVPSHKRRVGYIFQDGRLFPHLSVAQNLRYGRRFAPRNAHPADPDHVIGLLGIGHLMDRRPASLSGGEKQRVAIGRALLAGPDIILADEPLAALDAERKAEILPYFERLRDEMPVPVLYVSHDIPEMSRLASTVIALKDGRVAGQGPADEILSDASATPLGVRAAGSLISARVVAHHPDGLSELEADGIRLLLPRVPGEPGSRVRVRIDAQDVMLSLSEPVGISALNVLPATLTAMRKGDGPGVIVQLDAGGTALLARITRRSADALDLQPGLKVFAVIKAVSVPRDAVTSDPAQGE
ncbi:molybdenum ABC transporter ATP-binding protein [Roseobacter ponti]